MARWQFYPIRSSFKSIKKFTGNEIENKFVSEIESYEKSAFGNKDPFLYTLHIKYQMMISFVLNCLHG